MPRNTHAKLFAFVCALTCAQTLPAGDGPPERPLPSPTEPADPIVVPATSAETAQSIWSPPQEAMPLGTPHVGATQIGDTEAPQPERPTLLDRLAELGRIGAALGVVLALAILARTLIQRFGLIGPLAGGSRPSGVLSILARYPIARGQHLVLLRLGARVVLLHQSRQGLATLSEVTAEDEVADLLARIEEAEREGVSGKFQSMLSRFTDDVRTRGQQPDDASNEIIDLTRRPGRKGGALGELLGRRGSS